MKIWLIENNTYKKNLISSEEKNIAQQMSGINREKFKFSRSCLRIALSDLLKVNPLDIDICNNSHEGPKFKKKELGFLSLSYCKSALLIGWSEKKIGVDIERYDRSANTSLIAKKFFTEKEFQTLKKKDKLNNQKFIKYWVIKESIVKHQNSSFTYTAKNWQWNCDDSIACNLKSELKLKVNQFRFQKYEIGIACENLIDKSPIICF